MKRLLVLAALAVIPATSALALADDHCLSSLSADCDAPAHWAGRHETGRSRLAITTVGGAATLLLTEDVVAVQLSDRTFHKIERKLRDERHEHEEDNALGQAIKEMILTGVTSLLNHSQECDLRDIRDASVDNGRLVLRTRNGRRLFSDVEVDDDSLMESFSAEDALAFVREFYVVKGRR
ncbi:MAG TPA: hypothetical protein VL332_01900 [Candidatus Saccharimonadaceae bacterium]|jgi:hypothetical protein|nr:hypothetical protein [Candidatus Saccharimonadaceae bacterium]